MDLTQLPHHDAEGRTLIVVETPQASRTKLTYDVGLQCLVAKKLLPQGMSFPFDYGFIPSTLGEDGDPIDVIVLIEAPVAPGTVVPARLIGVIEADQTERDGATTKNDRLIAVATISMIYREIRKLEDLPESLVEEIERFFISYNEQAGKTFTPTGRRGPRRAKSLVDAGAERYTTWTK